MSMEMNQAENWNDGHDHGLATGHLKSAIKNLVEVEFVIGHFDEQAPEGSHSTFLAEYRDKISDAISMMREAVSSIIDPPNDEDRYEDDEDLDLSDE